MYLSLLHRLIMLSPLPQKDTSKAISESHTASSSVAYFRPSTRIQALKREDFSNEIKSPLPPHKLSEPTINEKQLNDTSNHRFSHLLSIMPAGVLVLDKKGSVSLANQQAKNLLGEPLVGLAWRDVISRVFTPKADDGHEVSMRNGKRVKIDISPLTEEKGQLIVITDLTETRQLQSAVGHMQRLSSLGKMVASLAHQVRTPLSSALLYAENLKSMPLNNSIATQFSEKLTLRLKELESQVNDMLLFAKSSDNQIVTPLSVQQIQDQAIAQVDAQLKQAKVSLTINNNTEQNISETSNSHVLGNLTAISGALTNLISNAMQAQIRVNGELKPVEESVISLNISNELIDHLHYCVFSVVDKGKGLDAEKLSHIFEPFYTTKSQGTGLGLAVVNTVAKSHKGMVKCGNNPDKGAFFSLYLPLNLAANKTSSRAATAALHNQSYCKQGNQPTHSQQSLGAHHE